MSASSVNIEQQLKDAIRLASARKTPLCIVGGNTKSFYARTAIGTPLEVGSHSGVLEYEPSELVITARGGTPLAAIRNVLSDAGQMLAFEPPGFGDEATIGGTIACALSGPARPYTGSARDFMLGARIINGKGEILSFGGRVMKNVAGYDVSRLMTGALGTLGLMLEVSMKVLPIPASECTLLHECSAEQALQHCIEWTKIGVPLSATCFHDKLLYIRLWGAEETVNDYQQQLGGKVLHNGRTFWNNIKEHRYAFFPGDEVLWRLSVPPATPMMKLDGEWLMEWGGALRWLRTGMPAETIRKLAAEAGGHAVQFRGGDRSGDIFHPLNEGMKKLHTQLRNSFDPEGILNPGRMYANL